MLLGLTQKHGFSLGEKHPKTSAFENQTLKSYCVKTMLSNPLFLFTAATKCHKTRHKQVSDSCSKGNLCRIFEKVDKQLSLFQLKGRAAFKLNKCQAASAKYLHCVVSALRSVNTCCGSDTFIYGDVNFSPACAFVTSFQHSNTFFIYYSI